MTERLGIIISGARGRMGQALVEALADHRQLELVGALEHAEHPELGQPVKAHGPKISFSLEQLAKDIKKACLIDFSAPQATLKNAEICTKYAMPMVIGTTGFKDNEIKMLKEASQKIPIVMAANYSIGVNLVRQAVEELARRLPESYDLEIVEIHHKMKKDAPSGTALALAQSLANGRGLDLQKAACYHREGQTGIRPKGEIGIQSLRGGDIVGDHTVIFAGPGERIEVIHRAHNRSNFANGALKAATWIGTAKPGLYDMLDVLNLK